jgi:hypothetical protein
LLEAKKKVGGIHPELYIRSGDAKTLRVPILELRELLYARYYECVLRILKLVEVPGLPWEVITFENQRNKRDRSVEISGVDKTANDK